MKLPVAKRMISTWNFLLNYLSEVRLLSMVYAVEMKTYVGENFSKVCGLESFLCKVLWVGKSLYSRELYTGLERVLCKTLICHQIVRVAPQIFPAIQYTKICSY